MDTTPAFVLRLFSRLWRDAAGISEDETASGEVDVSREVRLALVMNGGVSLAVWIGGVTNEVDCIRRAHRGGADDLRLESTAPLYHELLSILDERVLVDVIAGASAGGINGALLAAAIYSESALPSLRDTWITVGDFQKLLRDPARRDPPSLLRGDEFVLAELEKRFDSVLAARQTGPSDQPLYLYVTATDFYGVARRFQDSSGRTFAESDHRRVFCFEHEPGVEPAVANAAGTMPIIGSFAAADAAPLLARAARSSSSFPVAFEPHELAFEDETRPRWLIDGGILDNQPFNPVLDRISTISAGKTPVKRVVGYVVPYVTGVQSELDLAQQGADLLPSAKQTYDAANKLPRDLPKLVSLERVIREEKTARRAEQVRTRLANVGSDDLGAAAEALFPSYRRTRYTESLETLTYWSSEDFRPGSGAIAQDESLDPLQVTPVLPETDAVPDGLTWIPDDLRQSARWSWGLSPSERVAGEALAALRQRVSSDPSPEVLEAKRIASELVADARRRKIAVRDRFIEARASGLPLEEAANQAYKPELKPLGAGFRTLAAALGPLSQQGIPSLQSLLCAEVVHNAFGAARASASLPFEFIHMSAGVRNSLGHRADTPGDKLAGMKLSHFAGFLKRSWRANDWLWGRLDGVEYLVRAAFDLDHLCNLGREALPARIMRLSALALPTGIDDDKARVLRRAWLMTLSAVADNPDSTRASRECVAKLAAAKESDGPREQFAFFLAYACGLQVRLPEGVGREVTPGVAKIIADCCRSALAARIQLEIVLAELPRVAEAVQADTDNGASRAARGVDWLAERSGDSAYEQIRWFYNLSIGGDERPQDEVSSKLGAEVFSQGLAVGAAAFSGSRGGLPAAIRAPLATLRGLTLVASVFARLIVRTPPLGLAALLVSVVALVWALVAPNAALGAALPALLVLLVAGAAFFLAMLTSPLEGRSKKWRWHRTGLLLLLVLPLALLVVTGLPWKLGEWLYDGSGWDIRSRATRTATNIIGALLIAAALVAITRMFAERTGRRFRIALLWTYRWIVLLAVLAFAAGLIYLHMKAKGCHGDPATWTCVADERRGYLVFLLLVAALSLAPLVAELAAGGGWIARKLRAKGAK